MDELLIFIKENEKIILALIGVIGGGICFKLMSNKTNINQTQSGSNNTQVGGNINPDKREE